MKKTNPSYLSKLNIIEVAYAFDVDRRSVTNWVKDGCPKNPDGTMSIVDMHKWLIQREAKKHIESDKISIKDRKALKDIEMADVKIAKLRSELVERTYHEDVCASVAKTTSEYWRTAVMKNSIYMANQPKSVLDPLLMQFLCEGTKALVEND